MNTLRFILALAFAIWLVWPREPRPDPVQVRHETAIQEHRVILAMTREEVTRSLGEPDSIRETPGGNVVWGWMSGRWVMFSGRALIDSGYFDAKGNLTHDPAQQTPLKIPEAKPKSATWRPTHSSLGR